MGLSGCMAENRTSSHWQPLGAQPGKDFLCNLREFLSHRAQTPALTQEGKEGAKEAKCSFSRDSSCETFFWNKQLQWAQWLQSCTTNTAIWGQWPWVLHGYRHPAGWATRPLVGGILLDVQPDYHIY